ncbi:hypothetical protein ACG94X_07085 [Acinetobacter sp. ULE_I010]|uniref:hypothetical protein n=1 Tax=Acinetobacter sp. ULE_I010 TaxID=3373065 RepID=UPI003AF60E3C
MIPLLKASTNKPRTSEDLLENISDSLQRLEQHIAAMTRMSFDDGLPSDQFNAIMCGLHLQIYEITSEIKTFHE